MQKACPECRRAFEGQFLCPQCGVQLLDPRELPRQPSATAQLRASMIAEPTPDTLWGRLVVGLVLAQGLYYCGRQLCNAAFLAAGEPEWWADARGLAILQALQAAGLLVGGAIAGAGQAKSTLVGTLLGLFNAGLLLLVQWVVELPSTDLQLYGLPVFHAAVGALGGAIGKRVWKPLQAVPNFGLALPLPPPPPPAPAVDPGPPWAWGRIAIGATVAVAGALGSDYIRTGFSIATSGRMAMSAGIQTEFLTWQISVLAVVAGAGLAGAGTGRGFSQGLVVGLVTCMALGGSYLGRGLEVLPGQEAVCDLLSLPVQRGRLAPQMVSFLFTETIIVGALGGWLGGQLLPPIGRARRFSLYDESLL
jgi:hypothetical protein